ncbi:hypothetical protein DPMN_163727 [Dreissena polymorpha]|uniref:Uncharacterized protein n=1 Tax=Dreissena polymorpha TaxID=45954 RepID=A0A9D4ERQ1_DREPO|nr:hypothetical protein DPMN_163727 [Dreissena polymorpha]
MDDYDTGQRRVRKRWQRMMELKLKSYALYVYTECIPLGNIVISARLSTVDAHRHGNLWDPADGISLQKVTLK